LAVVHTLRNIPPVNVLRRLPLSRLLLLCGVALAVGIGSTALALALGGGPTPPPKPLADAVHDALVGADGHPVEGVSARIQFTNHLIEGASLASGSGGSAGQLASSPLLSGASGRLWISKDGRVRLELQSEQGDSQILYDGHTASFYDGSSNTLYRYTPQQGSATDVSSGSDEGNHTHEVPSVAKVEEAISHLKQHVNLSGATPTDVAGQPAYTVRVSPNEGGSLIGGAELSFDSLHGTPLRAAIYSTNSSAPVIELASSEISYGPVPDSVFAFTPPPGAKVEEVRPPHEGSSSSGKPDEGSKPKVTSHGHGISAIAVLEGKAKSTNGGKGESSALEGLQKVDINGTSASELRTELGTILSFERSGVRYVLAGAVAPAAIEALAKGL
jgi:outer membrane lipoprotein-sorting protein